MVSMDDGGYDESRDFHTKYLASVRASRESERPIGEPPGHLAPPTRRPPVIVEWR